MKVLWLSPTPSMYDEQKIGGWITSLESSFRKYAPEIELGIAFEYGKNEGVKIDGNITYFPINVLSNFTSIIISKFRFSYHWEKAKPQYLSIINDFKPDLIECFGSEWEYGTLAEEVNIPMLIHMQGFLNIQNYCTEIVNRGFQDSLIEILKEKRNEYKKRYRNEREMAVMRNNHFFLGRTDWDKNLVNYYSPQSQYYFCNETIRNNIYEQRGTWDLKKNQKPILLTITQGSPVKGNEIILQTASILKYQFGFDFEWRVAGNIGNIRKYEKIAGISFNDVNVKLLGMIDSDEVLSELKRSDIFINCSINDNSPNSICEAQLVGCPVISSNVGGISSIIKDKETGMLYPYNEPHTLAFIIMNLSNNAEKMKYLSENEIAVSSKRHDPKEIVNNLLIIYRDVIKRGVVNEQ